MKVAVKTQKDFFIPINGWNKAKLIEIKEEKWNEDTRTKAIFRFDGGSDKSFEQVTLTDKENNADVDVCNMIITAFGGKEIKIGDNPEPILKQCIGKEIALLAYPQANKKDQRVYMHTAQYGFIMGHPACKPLSAVGESFNEVIVPKETNKEAKKEDALPGNW